MSGRIANRMLQIVPSWLRAPMGWSFFGSMVAEMDSVAQDAADGAAASLIISCNEDVLDHHAINSNDRKSSVESYPQLRKYLLSRWDRKKEAGTKDGLSFQLARIGYSNPYGWVDIEEPAEEGDDPADDTVREVYMRHVLLWRLPIDAALMVAIKRFFVADYIAQFPQCSGDSFEPT